MQAFAYGLREHEIFRHPNAIDIEATQTVSRPKSWAPWITATEVSVVPLIDRPRPGMAGWCTSANGLEDSPEVEVMCGGVNTKTPSHAAVWRQGNLLHFGFQETPSEFNATGRALLENSIAYIARFTEDRPIPVTPAGFGPTKAPRSRAGLRQALGDPSCRLEDLVRDLSRDGHPEVLKMSLSEARRWLEENLSFLASDSSGRLAVDAEAKALGLALDTPSFLIQVLDRAASATTQSRALTLLERRVASGPGPGSTLETWRAALDSQRDYLFFSETGGYRWYLDSLAMSRRTTATGLRGSLRASRPALSRDGQ